VAVKITGNHGTQHEISVSTKVSKEIAPFQQEFPILECDVRNDPITHPEAKSDIKIRLRLPVHLGIPLRLHPKTFDSLRLRLRFRLRNPGLCTNKVTLCFNMMLLLMTGCSTINRGVLLPASACREEKRKV